MAVDNKFILTIFGASGSLAQLKIFPALYRIMQMEGCCKKFVIFGFSRTAMSDDEFRQKFREAIEKKFDKKDIDEKIMNQICENLYYHQGNYDNLEDYKSLEERFNAVEKDILERKEGEKVGRIFYLSIPPVIFKDVMENIGVSDLRKREDPQTKIRIVIEKPFGHDLESAIKLNRFLTEHFKERQIYRIDHYLGKEAVLNMLIFRFTNAIMEPVFNTKYISNVQITASEDIGIEERAGYFDSSGIVRDMIQPHVFQLLSLIAMERPYSFTADAIKDEKVKLLKCIRPIDIYDIENHVVRGQYDKGEVDGKEVVSYLDEKDIKDDSKTESYAAMKLYIDNHRWFGVPFFLRSGKRLNKKITEVNIEFKNMPSLCTDTKCTPIPSNILTIRIQPEEAIFLQLTTKESGTVFDIKHSDFIFYEEGNEKRLDAYSRLILDAINGQNDLFIRFDEIEAAWSLVDPVIKAFEENKLPLHLYPAGTLGPDAADNLIQRKGYKWINH